MSMIRDRYASAIHSPRLTHDADTSWSDTDVLAAMGFAAKRYPLSHMLARLWAGDSTVERQITEVLAHVALQRAAKHGLKPAGARELAQTVLRYCRDPKCRPCGGVGYQRIEGAPALSSLHCRACQGTGRVFTRRLFKSKWADLGDSLIDLVHAEAGRAMALASAKLLPQMQLDAAA